MKSKLTVFVALVAFPVTSFGLDSFSYSGRLVNSDGSPVTDKVNLRFDLSSTENASDILCSKTVTNVPLSQGIFNVKLQFLPADCENNSIQSIMESIPTNHNLVYQVTDLTNSRTYSQQAIYSVPSSFMANFAKSLSDLGATDGQVLLWNAATSKWIPGNAGSGNGTVTGIQTGAGLTGGPITTNGTIAIAAGGVQDSHLQGNINPTKLAGARDATMYLKGNNTWSTLGTDVLSTLLNSFAVITGSTVSSSDTIMQGLGKLQGQVTDLSNNKLDKTGGTLMVGTIDGVPTPVSPSQIVNKSYVDNLVGGVNASQWGDNASGIHYNLGDVGIGTTNPDATLDVYGSTISSFYVHSGANDHFLYYEPEFNTLQLYGDGAGLEIESPSTGTAWLQMKGGAGSGINIRSNSTVDGTYTYVSGGKLASAGAEMRFINENNATKKNAIAFTTSADGSTSTEHVRITSAGYVGIGIATPGAKLEVAGQIKITGGNPGVGKILTSDASGLASWSTPGGSTPTGAAGGELSGTYPDPTIANGVITDVKVAAGANIAQSKIANLSTDLSNKQAVDSDLTALAGLGTTGVIVRTGAGTVTTRSIVGTTNRVTVTNGDGVSGNPLINVSTALLPSPAAGDAGKFLKASSADTASWESFLSSDVTTALGFTPVNKAGDSISSGTFDFNGTSVVRVKDPVAATDAANKQYVDNLLTTGSNQWGEGSGNVYRSTGNVGIGTNSPSFPLDIQSSGAFQARLWHSSNNQYDGSALMMTRTRGTLGANTAVTSGDTLGGIYIRAHDGAGTGTTNSAIEVSAGENHTGTNRGTYMIFETTTNGSASRSEKMRIHSNGNVGIGTVNPGAKLEVVGDAKINGVTIGRGGGNGAYNTAIGNGALSSSTSDGGNTAVGRDTLSSVLTGYDNTAVGYNSLRSNISSKNTAVGVFALEYNSSGSENVSLGWSALGSNTTGMNNTSLGGSAGLFTQTGNNNTLVGWGAGYGLLNNSYSNNTILGTSAGSALRTGSNNILLGYQAGNNLTTGNNNIIIGYNIDAPAVSSVNTLNIGNLIFATGIDGVDGTLSTGKVGIGTKTPQAGFDIATVGTGGSAVIVPRDTTANRPSSPVNGMIRYNTTTLKFEVYENGAWTNMVGAVSAVTSLNGSTDSSQTFAYGTSGAAPDWSTASGVHTLNIPFASAAGVTAGLLSKTDYDAFSAKLGATLSSGRILVGNGSNVATAVTPSGDVSMTNTGSFTVAKLQGRSVATTAPSVGSFLKWNNTLSNWEPFIFSGCSGASQVLHYILATDTWSCDTINLTSATGTLPIANGGTGATTANAALNNFLPSQTGNSGKFLSTDGTSTSWITASAPEGAATIYQVKVATTQNIALSGLQTIDTIVLAEGDRVLVKNQTTQSQNGIYVASAGAWTRASDFDTWADLDGYEVMVRDGYAFNGFKYSTASNTPGTMGTTAVRFITQGASRFNENIGLGRFALNSIANSDNVAIGAWSMTQATSAWSNTAIGNYSLQNLTSGSRNAALGTDALLRNQDGVENTGVGNEALEYNISGNYNTAIGRGALQLTTGSGNLALGYYSGSAITTGTNNVVIGANDGASIATSSSNILVSDGAGNIRLRVNSSGNVGIGTTAPGAKLEVAGQVKITGGTPGVGKVLTSDSTGLATWETPSGGGDFMKDGSVTMTGSLKLADGTAALPSLTLGSDSDTGFFKYTENMFGISLGGVGRYYYTFDSTFGNARLGINTIPTRTLHVKQQTVSGVVATFEAPAGAALELKRTGSSMFIQQDVVGNLLLDDDFNEETTPSFFVSITNGNVGIGTSTDTYKLNVGGDINSTTALRIAGTQVCTSAGCTSSSDERLKENVRPLENALDKILKLQGVEYNYIDKSKFGDNHQVGVIAQDVEKVFPEVVLTDEKSGFKSVAYDHLVAPLIEAFKTLHERQITQSRDIASLEALKVENEELRKENEEIKARLQRIEQALKLNESY